MLAVILGGITGAKPIDEQNKEGWYRLTTFAYSADTKTRLEGGIFSAEDIAAAMEVECDWLLRQDYGAVYDSLALGDDSLWIRLTKYPNYLLVVL
jgi:hypothetical protein